MSIKVDRIKDIKSLFPSFLVFVVDSSGNYVRSYDDDAIILSYLYKRNYHVYSDRKQISFLFKNFNLIKQVLDYYAMNYLVVRDYEFIENKFYYGSLYSLYCYQKTLKAAYDYHADKKNNIFVSNTKNPKSSSTNFIKPYTSPTFSVLTKTDISAPSKSHYIKRINYADPPHPDNGKKICKNCAVFRRDDCWGEAEICDLFQPCPGSYSENLASD